MKKKICVLQVAPSFPNEEHVALFREKKESDFFFVTHDSPNPEAMQFCPNTTWVDTRNTLAKQNPGNYEYYAFIDYDYVLRPQEEKNALEQILFDLEKWNPAVLTYYPGRGLITPFAADENYFKKNEYSIIPFTHCGLKIVHHSLMDWFFPMVAQFGGGVEACHLFNIMEIPFLNNVICSHKMIYDNGVSSETAPHNENGAWSKYRMDEMWKWIQPSFRKSTLIQKYAKNKKQLEDSLLIKEVFISLFKSREINIEKSELINFLDKSKISKFFDLSHERFINLNIENKNRPDTCDLNDLNIINSYLSNVTFESLVTQEDPWDSIVLQINKDKNLKYKITTSECVNFYQKINSKSLFKNSNYKDKNLNNYLKNKKVALVGPSPYLSGQEKGSIIDMYDVVVRIQHDILNTSDYGTRTDIVQSCLNSNYGPPLVSHIKELAEKDRPKFVISNDTASALKRDGTWAFVDELYDEIFKDLKVPFIHLRNKNKTWNRWALYWEIYAKQHIEKFSNNKFTKYSANFNSGYGSISFLLSYDLKELAVFGMDFYNVGIPQTNEEKYNTEYIKTYGSEGSHLGPDEILHDQISQIMHCRNVLLKDSRLKMDPCVLEKINNREMEERIEEFIKLPKFKKNTR